MRLARGLALGTLLVAGCAAEQQQASDPLVANETAARVNGADEMDACRDALSRIKGERGNAAKILGGQEDLGDPVLCDIILASKLEVFRLLDAAGIVCSDPLAQAVFEKRLVAETYAVTDFAAAVDKMCRSKDVAK